MKYKVRVNEEDYIRFNIFHMNHSKAGKRSKNIQRVQYPILSLVIILIFFLSGVGYRLIIAEAVFMTVFCVLWCIFLPKTMEKNIRKNIKKMKAEGKLPYHADSEIEFQESMIVATSEQGEIHINYEGIENIFLEQDYLYIFFGVAQAFIIPLHCLGEDKERVVNYIKEKTGVSTMAPI